jgi:hypothetical protein
MTGVFCTLLLLYYSECSSLMAGANAPSFFYKSGAWQLHHSTYFQHCTIIVLS